jgi:hypothetical protein
MKLGFVSNYVGGWKREGERDGDWYFGELWALSCLSRAMNMVIEKERIRGTFYERVAQMVLGRIKKFADFKLLELRSEDCMLLEIQNCQKRIEGILGVE